MSAKAHPAFLAAIIMIAAVLPASAQGFNPDEIKRMQANMPNIGRAYSIRVTTGTVTNDGFEKALTQTDPNLKHWCWVPVTTMKQAYIHTAPGQVDHGSPKMERPKSVYAAYRPVRAAMPTVDHGQPFLPRQIAYRSTSRGDVSGTLSYAKTPPARAFTGETKVYSNSDISGRLRAPRYSTAYSDSKDCYGKLVH
jgi:hypothetical protein